MRDDRDRARIPGGSHFVAHIAAVYNHAARAFEQPPRHCHAFVIRPDLERPHLQRERSRRRAAVVFAFGNVGVPIIAADGEIGDEMVQIRFMHHHNPGILQGCFVNEIVVRIVTHLVNRDVELRRVEGRRRAGENLQIDDLLQRLDQSFGIIRDSASRRRQRREKLCASVALAVSPLTVSARAVSAPAGAGCESGAGCARRRARRKPQS